MVPIAISDSDTHQQYATIHLRIYVDDQDDNEAEIAVRTIHLEYSYEIPDVIILHALPVDADQVGVYNCWLSNVSQAYYVCPRDISNK